MRDEATAVEGEASAVDVFGEVQGGEEQEGEGVMDDFVDPYTGHVISARTLARYGFTLDPGSGEWVTQWQPITTDHTNADAPVETCVHPMALVKLSDGLATCDGCGRVFELRDFELPVP